MLIDTRDSPFALVKPLPQKAVTWKSGFWKERSGTCASITVPHIRELFECDESNLHVVENFRIAAGITRGPHMGTAFGDGDFYKWMEAAMYAAANNNDLSLEKVLEGYIDIIARAQQPDGYISTKQIIAEKAGLPSIRNRDINDFEVYNFGHLFTAACIHYRLTGKRNFLDIAEKAAAYLEKMYQDALVSGDVKTAVCPSHYMGLIELYRTTAKRSYLDLAALSIQLRDKVKDGTDDNQDRLPLKEHRSIVGHAVRATYLYAGLADLYLETGDPEYKQVLDSCWENCVQKKMYITGGCGALYQGVSPVGNFDTGKRVHQAFGYEYQLPNITAYNETCAALGSIFWNYRMFAINPEAKYFDIIEKTFYNASLSGLGLKGNTYFYENMLRRTKSLDYELPWPLERKQKLECNCCPPNLARTIIQSQEYAYMVSGDSVYTGLYGANEAEISLDNGAAFTLIQETRYPWDGTFIFSFKNINNPQPFTLNLRIPSWVETGTITTNRKYENVISNNNANTYIRICIDNPADMVIHMNFGMNARLTMAHPMIEEDINQVAVERGPLVYCIETPDADIQTLDELMIPGDAQFETVSYEIHGYTVTALKTEGIALEKVTHDTKNLYHRLILKGFHKTPVRMIPYFAWDNRGFGEMRIWLPIYFRS